MDHLNRKKIVHIDLTKSKKKSDYINSNKKDFTESEDFLDIEEDQPLQVLLLDNENLYVCITSFAINEITKEFTLFFDIKNKMKYPVKLNFKDLIVDKVHFSTKFSSPPINGNTAIDNFSISVLILGDYLDFFRERILINMEVIDNQSGKEVFSYGFNVKVY